VIFGEVNAWFWSDTVALWESRNKKRPGKPGHAQLMVKRSAGAHRAERHVAIQLHLLRQTEHALADDVALDLIGTAADRGHVGKEGAVVDFLCQRMRLVIEQAFGADD